MSAMIKPAPIQPILNSRHRISGSVSKFSGFAMTFSPKIPRAKALVGFSRYRAAQKAARYEEGLKLDKTDCFFLPRFVSDAGYSSRSCQLRRPILRHFCTEDF